MNRLLFFLHRYPNYGGTEKVTTILCNKLLERGFDITIVSLKQVSWELMDELNPAIKFVSLSYPILSWRNIRTIRRIVKEYSINIVVNQWCLPFITTMLLRLSIGISNVKLVSVLHGAPDVNMRLIAIERKLKNAKGGYRLFQKLHLLLLKLATRINLYLTYVCSDRYVLLSEKFIGKFKKLTGLNKTSKLFAISNPITINVTSCNMDTCDKEKKILYVGRMDMLNKNVDRIVRLWELLCEEFTDWGLILVGDGPDRNFLEKMSVNKGLKNIEFLGFMKEEPVQYYMKSSILLLTSDLEGFGLVVTEGMSFGCIPIVYGSYDAIFDIIDDGVSGYITPCPYDEDYTYKKLKQLMIDKSLRYNMSQEAYLKSGNFTVDTITDKWVILFNKLI